MLRLEKTRGKEICISLRPRERAFSHTLLYAFAIALSLHVLAALIFHVGSFFMQDAGIASPISVEADLADAGTFAMFKKEMHQQHYHLAPNTSEPVHHAIEVSDSKTDSIIALRDTPSSNPFLPIEGEWNPFAATGHKRKSSALRIHVFGALAEVPLLSDGTATLTTELAALKRSSRATYAVQIEHQEGRVFWHMPTQKQEDPILNQLAQRILQNMRFKSIPSCFVTLGEIEFSFGWNDD